MRVTTAAARMPSGQPGCCQKTGQSDKFSQKHDYRRGRQRLGNNDARETRISATLPGCEHEGKHVLAALCPERKGELSNSRKTRQVTNEE